MDTCRDATMLSNHAAPAANPAANPSREGLSLVAAVSSLRWLGAGLTLLSLGLLGHALMTSGRDVAEQISDTRLLALTLALSLVHAALLGLPAFAWARIVDHNSPRSGSALTGVKIYARCNILKYLPGNVFHFGGRQVLARQAGWAHQDILLASLLDTASLPLTAMWVALALLGFAAAMGGGFGQDFSRTLVEELDPAHLVLAVCAVAGVTIGGCVLAFRRGVRPISLATMAAFNTGFSAASAALVVGLASALSPAGPAELSFLAAAYLASWVVGFLVPGAPGGLGVREALFVQLATTAVSPAAALTLAILTRLVTSLGDLWFALAALVSPMSGATTKMSSRSE